MTRILKAVDPESIRLKVKQFNLFSWPSEGRTDDGKTLDPAPTQKQAPPVQQNGQPDISVEINVEGTATADLISELAPDTQHEPERDRRPTVNAAIERKAEEGSTSGTISTDRPPGQHASNQLEPSSPAPVGNTEAVRLASIAEGQDRREGPPCSPSSGEAKETRVSVGTTKESSVHELSTAATALSASDAKPDPDPPEDIDLSEISEADAAPVTVLPVSGISTEVASTKVATALPRSGAAPEISEANTAPATVLPVCGISTDVASTNVATALSQSDAAPEDSPPVSDVAIVVSSAKKQHPAKGELRGEPSYPLSAVNIHPAIDDLMESLGLAPIWKTVWNNHRKTPWFATVKGMQLLVEETEFRGVMLNGSPFVYSNTWILKHAKEICAPQDEIRVRLQENVREIELSNAVYCEYVLRHTLYLLPRDSATLSMLRKAYARIAKNSGLIAKVTIESFALWFCCCIRILTGTENGAGHNNKKLKRAKKGT